MINEILTAGVEKIIDLGIDAQAVYIINDGKYAVYVKNNETAAVGAADAYVVAAKSSMTIAFGNKNCQYLHVISASAASIDIKIKSTFKAVHRGTTVAGQNKAIDFREPVVGYVVQNLSDTETLYVSEDGAATVAGDFTIELPPGLSYTGGALTNVNLISSGAAKYQVVGSKSGVSGFSKITGAAVTGKVELQVGGSDVAVGNPAPISNIPFEATLEITRPANTTQYTIQDIFNAAGATTLPYFDLSAFGANRKVIINYMTIMSDYAAAATKATCDCKLYSINNPIADCTDNVAFNPTYDAQKNRMAGIIAGDADQPGVGSGAYMVGRWRNEQQIVHTDANGHLYCAVIATNAYTPASGEKLFVRITGFVQ